MGLLEPTPELRLAQTSEVLPRLADASAAVSHRSSQPDKPLIIGFALGASSGVSRAINEITQGREAIRLDDVPAQLAFIEQDLKAATHVSIRAHDGLRYVVNGARIQYSVQQWRRPEPTWDVGFCTKVELAPPESLDQLVPLDGRHIEPRAAPELARTLLKARQRAAAWDVVLPPDTRVEALSEQQRRILDFFVLTNQLDALLSAARIWPVKVVDVYERNDGFEIEVTPAPEEARDSLAISLKLSQTATQMRDGLFSLKPSGDELKFEIDEEGLLVRREGPRRAAWRYERAYHHSAGDRYVFWTDEVAARPPLHGAKAYVMPAGLGGTVAQLKRRQRAIENMRQHAGLLSAIADPDASRRDTSDKPRQSEILEGLDSSKRQALDAIWGTQPLFTLQGPPGTGKTRLLETGIVTLLEEDPTRQILVTAQSHEAVKNVERKLLKRLAEQTNPSERLIIRLDDDKDDQHVTKVATDLRASLAKSDLANKLPDGLRRRLVAEAGLDVTTREARSFEVLVRDSANIVLATSNSGDLARMEGNRTRFDWSIVEEAGKAHGFDLALALQSSPRVVLIGDQAQLPPFNYEALYALFNEPDRILEAIKLGGGFAPSLVDRTFSVLTEDDRQRFKQDAPLWRDMVLFFGDLFSRCLLSERRNVKMAYRLNEQHRMHPVICELVSDGFYKGDLETHEDARARFAKEPVPFTLRENSWLPDEPIVFVDLPWVQEDKSAVGEHGGRISGGSYRNDAEVEAAIAVLEQLRPVSGEACEVQLLAPYRGQVRALAGAAATALDEGRLDALKTATPPFAGKALGATVDEFQGNEADIVVVSLVRNNDESVGKGLGFLDQRRLNVLLSRARRKLVLVGSWRFLESRIPTGTRLSEDDPLVHIQTLMSWLEANTVPGRVARVDYAALKRDAS